MPKELKTEIAEMLDEDLSIPLDEEGEEVESGGDSVSVEGEKISTESTTPVEGVEGVEDTVLEKEVLPDELPVEGTPEGGEPAKEKEGKVGDVEGGIEIPVKVEDASVGEPPSELAALKTQVNTLMGLLNTVHQGGSSPQVEPAVEPETPADLNSFVQSVDFDSVMESKESFVNFFTKSMEIVRQQTAQSVMAAVPNYVSEQVQRNTTMQDVANEFYSANPELSPVKGYVANVASEVSTQNPTWDMAQVLTKAAEVAKSTLGLVGQPAGGPVPGVPAPIVSKPAPVLSGGTRTAKAPLSKKSGLQTEIDDFLID